MTDKTCPHVLYYSVVYILWSFVITAPIPGFLKYKKDTDDAWPFDSFQKVGFCLALYTELVNLQIFVMI